MLMGSPPRQPNKRTHHRSRQSSRPEIMPASRAGAQNAHSFRLLLR